ncbi:hypothetical protein DRZ78_01675 [Candidatus Aerophobetes bacterium]|uniref:Uncharacterized protein n=1 Tax=Aerophobetes bacterium TaxID=2030807 RepID=A0A662D577_UNCAE|nr:MAG: hypothetical protein DRZ78_01675 [Candidatus Aerophobetes bacterium]
MRAVVFFLFCGVLYMAFLLWRQERELDWWRYEITYVLQVMSPYIRSLKYDPVKKVFTIRVSKNSISPAINPFEHAFTGSFLLSNKVLWREVEKRKTYDVIISRKK